MAAQAIMQSIIAPSVLPGCDAGMSPAIFSLIISSQCPAIAIGEAWPGIIVPADAARSKGAASKAISIASGRMRRRVT